MQNHFELFHLPARFEIDLAALDAAYREVQGQVHPDRFVGAGDAEKRVAMQWATRANEAYQTLKNPLKRAIYLCELHGVDLQIESNTSMPGSFLMQQMEWREALEEAGEAQDLDALERLHAELATTRNDELVRIGQLLDAAQFEQAGQRIRQLMFLERLGEEIDRSFERMQG